MNQTMPAGDAFIQHVANFLHIPFVAAIFVCVFTVIFGGIFVMVWAITVFPYWLARQRDKHKGIVWLFWAVLTFIACMIGIFLGWLLTVAFIVAAAYLVSAGLKQLR